MRFLAELFDCLSNIVVTPAAASYLTLAITSVDTASVYSQTLIKLMSRGRHTVLN